MHRLLTLLILLLLVVPIVAQEEIQRIYWNGSQIVLERESSSQSITLPADPGSEQVYTSRQSPYGTSA